MIEHLPHPTATELDALTELWEASVRASHDDCSRWNGFAAFMGIEGDELSMLFVAPNQRSKGLGAKLVNHAMTRCGVRRVDVNEQNSQALGFYIRQGFRIVGRSPLDPSGKPYPILHLQHD